MFTPIYEAKFKIVILHTIYILFYVAYELSILLLSGQPFNAVVLIFFFALNITWFYFFSLIVLDQVNKMSAQFVVKLLILLLTILGYAVVILVCSRALMAIYGHPYKIPVTRNEIIRDVWRSGYTSALSIAFWHARRSINKTREVERGKRIQTELLAARLQSRVNPHFLFNSLMFLHEEIVNGRPNAARGILQLSEMMQYAMGTNETTGFNTIGQEAEQIERLITLHKMMGARTQYVFFSDKIGNRELLVYSTLFIDFVENIFKYAVLNDAEYPAIIELQETNGVINLKTHNKVAERKMAGHQTGIKDVRARLELSYPNKFELNIIEYNNEFTVNLKIMS